MDPRLSDERFFRVARYIEQEYGINLPPQKKTMIQSRLLKRAMELGCNSLDAYIDLVLANDTAEDEIGYMMTLVSTHLTSFFRETSHFTLLAKRLLPDLAARCRFSRYTPLLCWSAACSTGEEAYSLAMVLDGFRHSLPAGQRQDFEFAVLGTDLSQGLVDRAREGIFPDSCLESIPSPYRETYVMHSRTADRFRIVPELRDRVFFQALNLMEVPYQIGNAVHIIFCRNVLIYFKPEIQAKVVTHLFKKLEPGGYLAVGHSESLVIHNLPCTLVGTTTYQKTQAAGEGRPVPEGASHGSS